MGSKYWFALKVIVALVVVAVIVCGFLLALPIYFVEQQESRQKAKDELGVCYCKDPMEDGFVKLYNDLNLEQLHEQVRAGRETDQQRRQRQKLEGKLAEARAMAAGAQGAQEAQE